MVRRVLQFIIIAFVVGEITVRFDERMLFFQNTRDEMLANTYKETRERTLIDRGALPIQLHDVRVMLLGDSKLYGVGIRPENSVAAIIRSRLRNDAVGDVYVLDLTEPGSNTFYNRRAFDEYVDAFVPQVVILAYNHNDVYGDQGEGRSASSAAAVTSAARSEDLSARDRFLDVLMRARAMVARSHALSWMLVQLNMQLKLAGVVVPGTEFDHLINRSHAADYPGWIAAQRHLREMTAVCRERHISMIFYIVPELEMLPRYSVFTSLDRYLMGYCRDLHVRCLNGVEPFLARAGQTFALSRYDGHPNEAAHEIMAEDLAKEVRAGVGTKLGETRSSQTGGRSAPSDGQR